MQEVLIRMRLLLFLGLLLIQITGSKAQDLTIDEYPEWLQVLDIQFDEGVEILAGDWEHSAPNPVVQSFGDVTVDYMNYTLTLADGRVIDLPQSRNFSSFYRPLDALRVDNRLLWFAPLAVEQVYVIELDTGTMTPSSTVSTPCGEQGYYLWKWVVREQDGQEYLCELTTGELIGPFVFDEPETSLDPGAVMVSPDEKIYLVNVHSLEGRMGILIIDLETHDWKLVRGVGLAPIYAAAIGGSVQWVGSDYLLLNSFNVARGGINYAQTEIIDVNTAELLHHFFGNTEMEIRSNTIPRLKENPLRVEAEYVTYSYEAGRYTHCVVETYYLESRELIEVDYGSLCYLKAGEWDGIGFFLASTDALDASTSYRREEYRDSVTALVRRDGGTGQSEVIYAGVIEDIVAISPDENYALMRLSYDESVRAAFDPSIEAEPSMYSARFVLMDLRTEEILYESVSNWTEYPISSWEPQERLDISMSNHSWSQSTGFRRDYFLKAIDDANQVTSLIVDAERIQGLGEDWYAVTNAIENERLDLRVVNAYSQSSASLLSFSNLQHSSSVNAIFMGDNRFSVRFRSNVEDIPHEQSYIFTLRIQ